MVNTRSGIEEVGWERKGLLEKVRVEGTHLVWNTLYARIVQASDTDNGILSAPQNGRQNHGEPIVSVTGWM